MDSIRPETEPRFEFCAPCLSKVTPVDFGAVGGTRHYGGLGAGARWRAWPEEGHIFLLGLLLLLGLLCQEQGMLLTAALLSFQMSRSGGREHLREAVRTAPHDESLRELFFVFLTSFLNLDSPQRLMIP